MNLWLIILNHQLRHADELIVRLSIDSIPGIADLSKGERFRLIGGCYLRSFTDWRTWAGLVGAVVLAIVGQMAVRYLFPQLTTRQAPMYGCSGAVVFWLVGSHISSRIRGNVVRKMIRKRFPNLCSQCGYDLRATAGLCPECGHNRIPETMPV